VGVVLDRVLIGRAQVETQEGGRSMMIENSGLVRRVQGCALWAWTWYRSERAMMHLGCLALAVERRGLHRVELYPDVVTPFPVLVVSTSRMVCDVAVLAVAKATPHGWGFFDAMAAPWRFIGPCRDAVGAAERVAATLADPLTPSPQPFQTARRVKEAG
jgi:hypothetical protein